MDYDLFVEESLSSCKLELIDYKRFDAASLNVVFKCNCIYYGKEVVALLRSPKSTNDVFWGNAYEKFVNEAKCMKFAREKFSGLFQVPFIYGYGSVLETPFLVMEFVNGKTLRKWIEGKTSGEVEKMAQKLLLILKGICDAEPPFTYIGSFNEGGLWFDGPNLKPCENVKQFVFQMISWSSEKLRLEKKDILADKLAKCFENMDFSQKFKIVFRHGDLSIDNLMVCENDDICFLDWEWSGVYDER